MKRFGKLKIARTLAAFLAPGILIIMFLLGASAVFADDPDGSPGG